MLSVSRDYDVDIKTLCYTVLHLEFRHLWHVGLQTIDEVEHFLPGIGSRHKPRHDILYASASLS
jgi:hypothetical protein